MSKRHRRNNIVPWLSARLDAVEKRFIQSGNSLFLSKKWQQMSCGARLMYLCMAMESGGKREFEFPLSAGKKYGIAPSSMRRYVGELQREGFLEVKSGACARLPNLYRFSFVWKSTESSAKGV